MSGAQAMTAACIGEPISWLRLERLALDELPDAAAARAHLDACPACAAAFAQIRDDARPLPALPSLASLPAASAVRKPDKGREADVRDADAGEDEGKQPWWRRWRSTRRWRLGGSLALAGAAAALLLWLQSQQLTPAEPELVVASASRTLRVKGGGGPGTSDVAAASDVTVTLVRERDGAVTFDPPDLAPGDRWKVQLTCAPTPGTAGLPSVWVDVAVVQGKQAGFPIAPALVACGNDVVVPGAFRITGGAAAICVTLDAAEPDRARFTAGQRRDAICTPLAPASPSTRSSP